MSVVKETVFIVSEENHGTIGVAVSLEAAARLIINEGWITLDDDIWCYAKKDIVFVHEAMAEHGYDKEDLLGFCTDMFSGKYAEEHDWCFYISERVCYH